MDMTTRGRSGPVASLAEWLAIAVAGRLSVGRLDLGLPTGRRNVIGGRKAGPAAELEIRDWRTASEWDPGFQPVSRFQLGGHFAHVAEVEPPMDVTAQVLEKGSTKLQLMCFTSPSPTGQPAATRSQLGFTHMSLIVQDLAAVEAQLAALGGTAIEQTREHSRIPGGAIDMLFMADPDGVRIELSQYTYR